MGHKLKVDFRPKVVSQEVERHAYQSARDQILNEKQAATYLNMSVKTLQAWRFQCKGPRFIKLSRSVRYRKEDLDSFLNANCVEPVA